MVSNFNFPDQSNNVEVPTELGHEAGLIVAAEEDKGHSTHHIAVEHPNHHYPRQ